MRLVLRNIAIAFVLALLPTLILIRLDYQRPSADAAMVKETSIVTAKTTKASKTTTQSTTRTATKTTVAPSTTVAPASSPYASILGRISAKDIDVMERLLYFECRGNGGEAVAEIVLNRVLSPSFPNTVQGVIYQSGQFSPANRLYSSSINEPGAFADCKRDVARVLSRNYQRSLPSHYLYFNNSSANSSDYRWVGGNVFY